MVIRCLAASLIACTLFPHIAQAGGPAPGRGASALPPYGVRVRGGGLVMTLFLTQPAYPQDALVKATVRLWNSTNAPMQVQEPTVSVLWPTGRIAYSDQEGRYPARVVSVSPPFKEPTGGVLLPLTIRPRQAIARQIFVIMRTGRIQATTALVIGRAGTPLKTGILLTRLGRAPYPTISIGKRDGTVTATIRPTSSRQGGTLWYMDALHCGSSGGVISTTGTITWTRVPYSDHQPDGSYRLPAPASCSKPSHWSLVAGWLGQPLGAANYSS